MRWAWVTVALGACSGVRSDTDGGEVLAAIDQPGDVALAGDTLYFVGGGNESYRLYKIPTVGGPPELVAENAVIVAMVADESGVYWNSSDAGDGRIMALRPGDAAPVELFKNPTWAWGTTYRNIILDVDNVYYGDTAGDVWKIPKVGGGATKLGTTDWVGALALSPDGIWVATKRGAKLLPAGPNIAFAPGEESPGEITWADGALFATFSGSGAQDGELVRVTLDGGPVELANRLMLPGELTAHDGFVYLTTGNEDSAIRRVPYSGGGSQALAQGRWPSGIAVDDTYVYWSDWQNDRVRRVPY